MKIHLVTGTGDPSAKWATDHTHPFRRMLDRQEIELATVAGKQWWWPSKLSGLPFINRGHWEEWALRFIEFMYASECFDAICHSHGGNMAIHAVAQMPHKMRTLTTVGTPVRTDVPNQEAAKNVVLWQHIASQPQDWTAILGAKLLKMIGDGSLSTERLFKIPGVRNIQPPGDIGHSDILNKPELVYYWESEFIIDEIKYAGLTHI